MSLQGHVDLSYLWQPTHFFRQSFICSADCYKRIKVVASRLLHNPSMLAMGSVAIRCNVTGLELGNSLCCTVWKAKRVYKASNYGCPSVNYGCPYMNNGYPQYHRFQKLTLCIYTSIRISIFRILDVYDSITGDCASTIQKHISAIHANCGCL